MLTLRGVHKSFATPRSLGALLRGAQREVVKVLDGIDLAVAAGEVVAIEGANGAGKSTLLRLVAGLLLPDAGTITIDAVAPGAARRAAARLYGYVPGDDRGLPQRATVRQTLALFAALRGVANTAPLVDELLDRRIAELSSGQRRRVQLACALLDPHAKLLLLDEPTRGLDPEQSARLWAELATRRARGVAVLIASHSAEERTALGARVLRLDGGKASVA